MKPFTANMINGLVLLGLGLWGYLSVENASPTALIAPVSGLIFLLLTPMMKKENKVVAHIVVLLTFLLLIAFIMPLTRQEGIGQIRVILMMASCLLALVVFVKSFIDARKAKS
ncbi:MAG: hypothetical protein AAF502_14410 [Bacteroidota bacterium]